MSKQADNTLPTWLHKNIIFEYSVTQRSGSKLLQINVRNQPEFSIVINIGDGKRPPRNFDESLTSFTDSLGQYAASLAQLTEDFGLEFSRDGENLIIANAAYSTTLPYSKNPAEMLGSIANLQNDLEELWAEQQALIQQYSGTLVTYASDAALSLVTAAELNRLKDLANRRTTPHEITQRDLQSWETGTFQTNRPFPNSGELEILWDIYTFDHLKTLNSFEATQPDKVEKARVQIEVTRQCLFNAHNEIFNQLSGGTIPDGNSTEVREFRESIKGLRNFAAVSAEEVVKTFNKKIIDNHINKLERSGGAESIKLDKEVRTAKQELRDFFNFPHRKTTQKPTLSFIASLADIPERTVQAIFDPRTTSTKIDPAIAKKLLAAANSLKNLTPNKEEEFHKVVEKLNDACQKFEDLSAQIAH